jgi:dihydroneopterin aldolase
MSVTVEIQRLEVFGHHGVEEDERRERQRFLYDVDYDVADSVLSDRIEDAVDYREVVAIVQRVSVRPFRLLEALAAAVADAIVAELPVERVRVRVRKPDVRLPVEHTAATVERRP